LQRAVLQPDTLDYAIEEFQRQLTAALGNVSNQLATLKGRREEIKGELRNLADVAARAGYSPTLIEAISEREQELDRITQSLFAAEPHSVSTEIERIREYVSKRLSTIVQLSHGEVEEAKAALGENVAEIRMVPQGEGRKGHYVAEGEWNLLGGYQQDSREKRVRMVAGEGFEPSTFGL
jgi:DNA repair exonuclease SbcCD ATPase subunit